MSHCFKSIVRISTTPTKLCCPVYSTSTSTSTSTCSFSTTTSSSNNNDKILKTIHDVRRKREEWLRAGLTVGLVPTMGALHQGHLDLVVQAKKSCDKVLASIFVNPTQFLPGEDFERYPRDLIGDMNKLSPIGVDYVFAPTTTEMYPLSTNTHAKHATFVNIEGIDTKAEGSIRPGHMRGVATVVSKLFNICQPNQAFFGQKDGLQCIVIKRLVRELNFPVDIVIVPTRRESDGLAMSSRNVYLSAADRKAAPVVYKALTAAQQSFIQGENQVTKIKQIALDILKNESLASTQYISVADTDTGDEITSAHLDQKGQLPSQVMISLAVKFGSTRLIDNCIAQRK